VGPRASLVVLETRKTLAPTGPILNYATVLETHTDEALYTATSIWNKRVCQVNCCTSVHTTDLGIHLFQTEFYSYNASFDVFTWE
jgi:hypothetical protein